MTEDQTSRPTPDDDRNEQPEFRSTPAQGDPTRVYEPMKDKQRKLVTLYVTIVAVAFVIIPFLFWRGTWFGRPLPDEELEKYLNDKAQPRHIQHALVQIGERIEKGDTRVQRWYPAVAELASSPMQELRVTTAFVLGTDPKSQLFHDALLRLVNDPDVLVRRNAALSLVRFNDAAGLPVIRSMFEPTIVKANALGKVNYRAQLESGVEGGTVIARIDTGGGDTSEVRTPVPGKVLEIKIPEGSTVYDGDELMVLSPGDLHVWEGLRALTVIGEPQDLELLSQFERFGSADLPEKFRQQAQLAASEIRRRGETPHP